MAGIGVVLNRNAGRTRSSGNRMGQKLAYILGEPDSIKQTSSADEVEEVAKAFLKRRIDILGIGGGDGSNHTTMTTFIKTYKDKPLPKVAFLCGGTHNAHATSLGIKGKPDKILQRIMSAYHSGNLLETIRRPILKINDGNQVHYGFTMATGYMYRFYSELIMKQGDSPLKVLGLLALWIGSYTIQGKKVRKMFELVPGKIEISKKSLPWESNNGVSCSTMEMLGLGFTPYPRAGENPDTFHVGVCKITPGVFIKMMWAFKRGKVPTHPDIHTTVSNQVIAESAEPMPYVLDGELYPGSTRLEISTGPKLNLIIS